MSITSKIIRAGAIAASLAVLVGFAGSASATTWTHHHPLRAEVNHRLALQNHRINRELRRGEITRYRARKLHREDRFVRNEERFMAVHHRGRITRSEHRALNRQENRISKQIGR